MTTHEIRTPLTPAEVIEHARSFFALAGSSYAAFPEQSGEGFLKLHLEVGEIMISAVPQDGVTWVRASASRGAHLLTRFLTTLAPPAGAVQTINRYSLHAARAGQLDSLRIAPSPAADSTAQVV